MDQVAGLRPRSKWGDRLGKLGWIPVGMIGVSPCLAIIAEALGPESDAAVIMWLVAVALIGLAIPLLLVWGAAWILFQLLVARRGASRVDTSSSSSPSRPDSALK